jgi:8-hydroxy-5-deazaflavin:NADPH oxidoreductase
VEPGTPVYGTPYLKNPSGALGEDPGSPADAAEIRKAVAVAVRGA